MTLCFFWDWAWQWQQQRQVPRPQQRQYFGGRWQCWQRVDEQLPCGKAGFMMFYASILEPLLWTYTAI